MLHWAAGPGSRKGAYCKEGVEKNQCVLTLSERPGVPLPFGVFRFINGIA